MSVTDKDLQRAVEECGNGFRLQCDLVRGHVGCCWSGRAESFLGLSPRCQVRRIDDDADSGCWRAREHKGDHETATGETWKRAKRRVI